MDFDLDDPTLLLRDDVLADPRPLYDTLRRRAPVWRLPGQETYLVSDPSLIRDAVGRPKEFSSNLVSLLHRGAGGTLVPFPLAPLGDPTHVLAVADPPAHTRQRRLLQPHLSAAAVARLEPALCDVVDRQIAPMGAAGRGDVVTQLSDPLPAQAICLLLGRPPEDAPALIPVVASVDPLLDGVTDLEGMAIAVGAAVRLHEYVQAKLDRVLDQPANQRAGLLGVLADAIDSGALPAFEAVGILVQLLSAGTETTSSLIANAIETLARRSDLQRRLRSAGPHRRHRSGPAAPDPGRDAADARPARSKGPTSRGPHGHPEHVRVQDDATYVLRPFLNRAVARRGATAEYTFKIERQWKDHPCAPRSSL